MGCYRVLCIALLLMLCSVSRGMATEISDDHMMLEWTTSKVWISGGELCVAGDFENLRDDITVTALNEFSIRITFTRDDGTTYEFTGMPKHLPMCKVPAGGKKRLTFNFGPFDGHWKTWLASEDYIFSYINGARW